jgi:hypothetical protein
MPRVLWLLLGYTATGLAIAGAVLCIREIVPASAPLAHDPKHFGPLIENWHRYRAISPKAKAAAMFAIVLTFGLSWFYGVAPTILAVQALVLTAVSTFILSRPNGPGPES